MQYAPLGEQEMEILTYVIERAPVTAGEVVEGFGEGRGLARSTILTVIERLRRKGYLARQRRAGVFHYSARMSRADVLQGLLHRFVETTLGGSMAPVVAYLAQTRRLAPEELAELQRLVEALKARDEERAEGGCDE